jgi:hypothetical protein
MGADRALCVCLRGLKLVVLSLGGGDDGMFGGMCRYDDASRLLRRNVRFREDASEFE